MSVLCTSLHVKCYHDFIFDLSLLWCHAFPSSCNNDLTLHFYCLSVTIFIWITSMAACQCLFLRPQEQTLKKRAVFSDVSLLSARQWDGSESQQTAWPPRARDRETERERERRKHPAVSSQDQECVLKTIHSHLHYYSTPIISLLDVCISRLDSDDWKYQPQHK